MSISLIKLSNIKVDNANLAANDYLYQSIALTHFTGFAHAIERWLNEQGCELEFAASAAMPIIHTVSRPIGAPKSVSYDYNSKSKATASRLLFQYQGNIEFSLLIAFVCDELADIMPHQFIKEHSQAFHHFLNQLHFAGGVLKPISAKQVSHYAYSDSLNDLLNSLDAEGYVLEDSSHLLTETPVNEDEDLLDKLLQTISRKRNSHSGIQGFCVPAAIGFRLLEEPCPDRIQRQPNQNYEHAFVEPMLGVIRLRSMGSYKKHYLQQEIPVWWQYQDDGNTLFVKAITTNELAQL